jgi:hypothetical protein
LRQIRHGDVAGELPRVVPARLRLESEAEELQIVLGDERGDLGQGQAMLLDVEQKVAAFAEAEEIPKRAHVLERRAVGAIEQLLPAAADVVRGRAIAARGDEIARRNDVAISL